MGSKTFIITYLQLSALIFGLEHFPENTPKRWEAIALYLEHVNNDSVSDMCTLCVDTDEATDTSSGSRKKTKAAFTGSAQDCKTLAAASLKELYRPLFASPDKKCPLKPLILTPPVRHCCGHNLHIRNRPCFPLVYTTTGTYIAASYHGNCTSCNRTYYPSYIRGSEQQYNISTLKYLQISSQTAFELKYLEQVTHQLSICSSTFENIADLYTMNNLESDRKRLSNLLHFGRSSIVLPWQLNPQRLEEGWFMYRLTIFFQSRNICAGDMISNLVNGRKDIESVCQQAFLAHCSEVPKWINHVCETPGCKERYATLDGNEKVSRTMCAAPKSKVQLPSTGLSVMSVCPNTPALGGNYRSGSRFCSKHINDEPLKLAKDPDNTKLSHLLPRSVHNGTKLDEVDDEDGCKKTSNITKYYNRTAGIIALVRPCGIVVNIGEMYTSESMTQMYLFLLQTFGRGDDIQHLRYLGYDRACGFHPFLVNLKKKDIYLATYLLEHVKFMVDRFHVNGHTESCCMPLDNPDCKYHPDLNIFSEVSSTNTECAEQAFRWLNKLKFTLRQMSRFKFNFFLIDMVELHNGFRELHLKAQGKMINPLQISLS